MLVGVSSISLFGFLKDIQSSSLQQLFKEQHGELEVPLKLEAAGVCGGAREAGSHSQQHMRGTTGISAPSSAISSPFAKKEMLF